MKMKKRLPMIVLGAIILVGMMAAGVFADTNPAATPTEVATSDRLMNAIGSDGFYAKLTDDVTIGETDIAHYGTIDLNGYKLTITGQLKLSIPQTSSPVKSVTIKNGKLKTVGSGEIYSNNDSEELYLDDISELEGNITAKNTTGVTNTDIYLNNTTITGTVTADINGRITASDGFVSASNMKSVNTGEFYFIGGTTTVDTISKVDTNPRIHLSKGTLKAKEGADANTLYKYGQGWVNNPPLELVILDPDDNSGYKTAICFPEGEDIQALVDNGTYDSSIINPTKSGFASGGWYAIDANGTQTRYDLNTPVTGDLNLKMMWARISTYIPPEPYILTAIDELPLSKTYLRKETKIEDIKADLPQKATLYLERKNQTSTRVVTIRWGAPTISEVGNDQIVTYDGWFSLPYNVENPNNIPTEFTFTAKLKASSCTVTFDSNGRIGYMPPQEIPYNTAGQLQKNDFYSDRYANDDDDDDDDEDDYAAALANDDDDDDDDLPHWKNYYEAFENWNTKPDGSGVSYEDGASITLKDDLTLYAQWSKIKAKKQVKFKNTNKTIKKKKVKNESFTYSILKQSGGGKIRVTDALQKTAKYISVSEGGDITVKKKTPNGSYIFTIRVDGAGKYHPCYQEIKVKITQ